MTAHNAALMADLAACVEALEPTPGKRPGVLIYNTDAEELAAIFVAKHHATIAALAAP